MKKNHKFGECNNIVGVGQDWALVYFSGPEIYSTKISNFLKKSSCIKCKIEQISTWFGAEKGCPPQG